MNVTLTLPTVTELADILLAKYMPFLLRESSTAGWQRAELKGVCHVAAADALTGFDPARGDLIARGHAKIEEQVRGAGFSPRGAIREDAEVILAPAANFDDPFSILAARQLADLLTSRGLVAAALSDDVGSERTCRRRVVERRLAAKKLSEEFRRADDK